MLIDIPDGVVALAAGTTLALGAAVVVLGPLLRDDPDDAPGAVSRDAALGEPAAQASAVDALREIEFDRATGKLSDTDYDALKASYTREALVELRARDATAAGPVSPIVDDAAVEAAIRRFRRVAPTGTACPSCGPRPEPDAEFCSSCGRFLQGRCASCGAACDEEAQRFCADCGHALAA